LKEPKFRCGTKEAIEQLAIELDLPYESWMQDWPYEVVNSEHFDKYLSHYLKTVDEDKKFVLMEMLIQAVNDQIDDKDFTRTWIKLEPLLTKDFKIHEYTVYYWACLDNVDISDTCTITSKMRDVWTTNWGLGNN
jgi:hypothetical protein